MEGVPGLGKTLLIRSLSEALQLHFSRIQFTPDLMPADVTGTTIVVETETGRDFKFRQGPIFAQIVLADEINRATPKTQSAMLEAMQERSVTVGGETYLLNGRSSSWQRRIQSSRKERILSRKPSWIDSSSSCTWLFNAGGTWRDPRSNHQRFLR